MKRGELGNGQRLLEDLESVVVFLLAMKTFHRWFCPLLSFQDLLTGQHQCYSGCVMPTVSTL